MDINSLALGLNLGFLVAAIGDKVPGWALYHLALCGVSLFAMYGGI